MPPATASTTRCWASFSARPFARMCATAWTRKRSDSMVSPRTAVRGRRVPAHGPPSVGLLLFPRHHEIIRPRPGRELIGPLLIRVQSPRHLERVALDLVNRLVQLVLVRSLVRRHVQLL